MIWKKKNLRKKWIFLLRLNEFNLKDGFENYIVTKIFYAPSNDVKLWFTTMYLVSFYSVPNLIVILFNLLYHVFIVGFDCKGYVIERECVCEDSSYWRLKRISRVSRDLASHEVMHVPYTWLECKESIKIETAVSREYLTGKAFPRDTRETFCFARLY